MEPEPSAPLIQLERIRTICVLVLTAIAVGAALYWLAPVMIPFALAAFISIALSRMVGALQRWLHLPRTVSLAVILLAGIVLLSALGALVTMSVAEVTANRAVYQAQLESLQGRLTPLLGRLGADIPSLLPSGATVATWVVGATNALAGIVSEGLVVVIFVIFLLTGSREKPVVGFWADIETRIQGYLLTKALLSMLVGTVTGIILALLGVDLALVFGVFAFLLNFIPNIGPVIATLLPLPIVLVNPVISTPAAIAAIALPAAMHFVVGNVFEPKIMGESLDLDPVVVLVTLIFWGMIWGFVGLLLATPITAVVKILLEQNELTHPVADALAGRVGQQRTGPPAG